MQTAFDHSTASWLPECCQKYITAAAVAVANLPLPLPPPPVVTDEISQRSSIAYRLPIQSTQEVVPYVHRVSTEVEQKLYSSSI